MQWPLDKGQAVLPPNATVLSVSSVCQVKSVCQLHVSAVFGER